MRSSIHTPDPPYLPPKVRRPLNVAFPYNYHGGREDRCLPVCLLQGRGGIATFLSVSRGAGEPSSHLSPAGEGVALVCHPPKKILSRHWSTALSYGTFISPIRCCMPCWDQGLTAGPGRDQQTSGSAVSVTPIPLLRCIKTKKCIFLHINIFRTL